MTWMELAKVIRKDRSLKNVSDADLRSLASDLEMILKDRARRCPCPCHKDHIG